MEDFLKAVGFIAPEGMTLEYFIVPNDKVSSQYNVPKNSNFELNGISKDLSKTYTQRDPKTKLSFSDIPDDSMTIPGPLPTKLPNVNRTTQAAINGVEVKAPGQALQIVETTKTYKSFILNESWAGFPKYTLFHFKKA